MCIGPSPSTSNSLVVVVCGYGSDNFVKFSLNKAFFLVEILHLVTLCFFALNSYMCWFH